MSPALSLALLLAGEGGPAEPPPQDANAFVRGLVGAQRRGEDALSRYAHDVSEVREQLDEKGRARRREIEEYEVFYVRGRPVRRLVASNNRELTGGDREREERRVRQLVEAIQQGRAVSETPGVRLSRILERYDFTPRGGQTLEDRCSLQETIRP